MSFKYSPDRPRIPRSKNGTTTDSEIAVSYIKRGRLGWGYTCSGSFRAAIVHHVYRNRLASPFKCKPAREGKVNGARISPGFPFIKNLCRFNNSKFIDLLLRVCLVCCEFRNLSNLHTTIPSMKDMLRKSQFLAKND